MPKNPEGVVPSDGSVSVFNKIIGKTYQDVYDTLEKANPTDAFRRKQTLNQITQILNQADADTQAWVKLNIPGFYEKGMFETVKGINTRGGAVNINNDFAHFHKEAIEALSQETYATIASGMVGIKNNAFRIINNATREGIFNKIASGQITGETRDAVRKSIENELKRQGISALVDKGGKTWDLRRYGDMLARTSLTRAHNTGVVNRMAGGGYDLVMVSAHYTSCDYCAPWQNEILSVGGTTPGFPSLKQAEGAGLFHPNCRHTYTPYHNEYFDSSQVWDTERQAYVPVEELKADNFHRAQFAAINKSHADLMNYAHDTYIGKESFSSTVGMKKQYSESGIKFDGSEVLPNKMTTHIIDDFGRKIETDYPELGGKIMQKMHAALDANQYKKLEDLQSDLLNMAKVLKVPANPLKYRISELEKSYFTGAAKLPPNIEKMLVVNPKSQVVEFMNAGTTNKVSIPSKYWKNAENSIMIHNHPGGGSFSMEDMLAGAKLNVSELRVVTKDYTYILKRPAEGWGTPSQIAKQYQNGFDVIRASYKDDAALKAIIDGDKITELSHYHIAGVTGNLKLDYSRVKTEFLETPIASDTVKITVYRGEGSDLQAKMRAVNKGEGGMFGNGAYYSTDKSVASQFGSVSEKTISLHRDEILEINTQGDYERIYKQAIAKFPDVKDSDLLPTFAKSEGYKAISGSANFDELAGINILDNSIFVK